MDNICNLHDYLSCAPQPRLETNSNHSRTLGNAGPHTSILGPSTNSPKKGSSYFHGLNPYEELVHAISTREGMNTSTLDILQKCQETCGRFSVALWILHYPVS